MFLRFMNFMTLMVTLSGKSRVKFRKTSRSVY